MKCTWLPRSRTLTPFASPLVGIAVEVGGPLLELGEVLDGLQRPLRAEQPLDVHAAQRGRVDAVAVLVGADVADGVRGGVGVAVGVAVEAGHARGCGLQAAAVVGGVELLLRKRRDQQPQAFELLGIEDVLEQLVEVRSASRACPATRRPGPAASSDRSAPETRAGRCCGRSKSRSKRVRSRPVCFLVSSISDFGKDHAARFVVRMRQREETRRPEIPPLDLLRRHRGELLPGHALGQLRRARRPAPACRATW